MALPMTLKNASHAPGRILPRRRDNGTVNRFGRINCLLTNLQSEYTGSPHNNIYVRGYRVLWFESTLSSDQRSIYRKGYRR